jgi:hypothetical protein
MRTERVNILQTREAIKNSLELLAKGFGCEFDFSGIECFSIVSKPLFIPKKNSDGKKYLEYD